MNLPSCLVIMTSSACSFSLLTENLDSALCWNNGKMSRTRPISSCDLQPDAVGDGLSCSLLPTNTTCEKLEKLERMGSDEFTIMLGQHDVISMFFLTFGLGPSACSFSFLDWEHRLVHRQTDTLTASVEIACIWQDKLSFSWRHTFFTTCSHKQQTWNRQLTTT